MPFCAKATYLFIKLGIQASLYLQRKAIFLYDEINKFMKQTKHKKFLIGGKPTVQKNTRATLM